MADWQALQTKFSADHAKTGIGVKAWCESRGINYATARRHIKLPKAGDEPEVQAQPATQVSPRMGNTNAVKHGGYRTYFDNEPHTLAMVEQSTLEDELMLARMRVHQVMRVIEEIHDQLAKRPDAEVAASLFESLFKADMALDKNIARVESICKTLSSLGIDVLNQDKIKADTARSKAMTRAAHVAADKTVIQTDLSRLQVDKAKRDMGDGSKLDRYLDELTGKADSVVNA